LKFLFYLGHPAHFHLFKNVIAQLRERGHEVRILIKKKDVLEQLLLDYGWEYTNILPKGRKDNRLSIAWGMGKRDLALWRFTRQWRPDLMAGTSVEIAHVGRLRGITSVVVNEDDWQAVPYFSRLVYPFCSYILAPDCCATGKWKYKTVSYAGYHELAYLHPHYFTPDEKRVMPLYGKGSPYFILRFAKLTAHHDRGVSGLHAELVEEIIRLLKPHGLVHITSERPLQPQFELYRMRIPPLDMHHALAFANLYIGDSQTMTAEAAVLGTPALRFNDFAGRIGYLEELQQRYKLTFGFRTSQAEMLLSTLKRLLKMPDCRPIWQQRRAIMLADKIDVTPFMCDFFERYAGNTLQPSQQE
jgi:uncharacterized protein